MEVRRRFSIGEEQKKRIRDYINHTFGDPRSYKSLADSGTITAQQVTPDYDDAVDSVRTASFQGRTTEPALRPAPFGTISFYDFGQATQKNSPYICVDVSEQENMCRVWDLCISTDVWKMPHPTLLLSITGSTHTKDIHMRKGLKDSIKKGLINVATKTGAWIITSGAGAGVTELVGQAVHEHELITLGTTEDTRMLALGVSAWDVLDNKEALTTDTEGKFDAVYSKEDLTYKENTLPLDANHTHFLFVSDDSDSKATGAKAFRTALEKHISVQKIPDSPNVQVPAVLLVLGGGAETLDTVLQALKDDTLVVIVRNTGGAADFIAEAYNHICGWSEKTELVLDYDVKCDDVQACSGEDMKNVDIDKVRRTLKDILKDHRSKLIVFDIGDTDSPGELDKAILSFVLKAKRSDAEKQLYLALAWNQCDIARQQIFGAENRRYLEKVDLNEAIITAMLQNKADFVGLFFEHGAPKKLSLREKQALLRRLYSENAHILCYPNEADQPKCPQQRLCQVGEIIKPITDVDIENLYKEMLQPCQCGAEDCEGSEGGAVTKGKKYVTCMSLFRGSAEERDNTIIMTRELFFWAILLNRQELAKILWREGSDPIGGALVASSILRCLWEIAGQNEEQELAQALLYNSEVWEKEAVGVLAECYQRNKEKTHNLLIREIPTWGNTTLFGLAESEGYMDFMVHTGCQTKLNRIWKGKMALDTAPWRIALCMIPVVFLWLIQFSGLKTKEKKKTSTHAKRETTTLKDPLIKSKNTKDSKPNNTSICWSLHNWLDGMGSKVCSYYKAPVTRFFCYVLSHLLLTLLFSYFVLTDLAPITPTRKPSYIEYIVWGWAATFFLEELRQMATQDPTAKINKLRSHFSSVWNIIDVVIYLFLLTSIILRYVLQGDAFVHARTMYSLTVAMYYLRVMHFLIVHKNVGPKVIMIHEMLKDLAFFMAILTTVVLAYGVSVQALLFPNSSLSFTLFKDIVYKPFWNIYGELFLEYLEAHVEDCTSDERIWRDATYGITRCPQKNVFTFLLMAAYMVITNILLVNLLIAMFSHTFTKVQEQSEKVWRYHFYSLVYEYCQKPILPPPLIIFCHIYRLLEWCMRKSKSGTAFRKKFMDDEADDLSRFEKESMKKYIQKMRMANGTDLPSS